MSRRRIKFHSVQLKPQLTLKIATILDIIDESVFTTIWGPKIFNKIFSLPI